MSKFKSLRKKGITECLFLKDLQSFNKNVIDFKNYYIIDQLKSLEYQ